MTDWPTQDEIVARIKDREHGDVFGFEWHEYVLALDVKHAFEFAKEGADLSDWEVGYTTVEQVQERLIDYLDFAWEKANHCRGISANRSVMHMIAWLWLMGGEHRKFGRAVEHMFDNHYESYGKPILRAVSERYGFDWRAHDNGNWTSYEGSDGPAADAGYENWSGRHLVPEKESEGA